MRHRQTKGPETDKPQPKPPRHFSTLHFIREEVFVQSHSSDDEGWELRCATAPGQEAKPAIFLELFFGVLGTRCV